MYVRIVFAKSSPEDTGHVVGVFGTAYAAGRCKELTEIKGERAWIEEYEIDYLWPPERIDAGKRA